MTSGVMTEGFGVGTIEEGHEGKDDELRAWVSA